MSDYLNFQSKIMHVYQKLSYKKINAFYLPHWQRERTTEKREWLNLPYWPGEATTYPGYPPVDTVCEYMTCAPGGTFTPVLFITRASSRVICQALWNNEPHSKTILNRQVLQNEKYLLENFRKKINNSRE